MSPSSQPTGADLAMQLTNELANEITTAKAAAAKQTWQLPDWPKSANAWVKSVLLANNIEPIGELVEVKCWALGQVLKHATTEGDVYFKATAHLPLFSNESQVAQRLSQLFPQHSATVITIDADKQWLLASDFGAALEETVPLSVWADAFNAFAKLQIASSQQLDALSASGCLTRDISQLPQQLSTIFNDSSIMSRLPESITAQPQHCHSALIALQQAISALQQYHLPNTLVHSDLHIENVAQVNGEYVFFDWSDACISHPFIDGTYLFRMPPSADKQQVIEAYLAQWRQFQPLPKLKQAWSMAEVVCYAHQAVSYAQMINRLPQQHIKDLQAAFENAFRRLFDKALMAT
ncbi:phosphotransferase family protein [Shewanella sp. UCD-KL21]|uniref:phosphotransferase family protein n=1 Tax=Shewanella sp. UCD-KL21 TaxID=1917164 RepID=UPI0009714D04|nr:phosphotransferase [Shewanella sp. UCD-KL21]